MLDEEGIEELRDWWDVPHEIYISYVDFANIVWKYLRYPEDKMASELYKELMEK